MAVDHQPTTSVIIPAYRASTLTACVERVLAQDYDEPYEVIVCVSADDASQLPALPHDDRLRVLTHVARLSAAAARNRAVAASRGQLLAFIDADAMADVDWLRQLVSASKDHLCVAGAVLNGTPDSAAGTVEYLVEFLDLHPARPPHTLWHGATCNLLVPRDLWELLGPFPEDLEGGEDTLLTVAARGLDRFVFAPDARVTHLNRTQWSSVFRHQVSFGRFTARLARRSPYKWRPLVRFTALAPIAVLGRIFSIYARVVRWHRDSLRGHDIGAWCGRRAGRLGLGPGDRRGSARPAGVAHLASVVRTDRYRAHGVNTARLFPRLTAVRNLGRALDGTDNGFEPADWNVLADVAIEQGLGPALWANFACRAAGASSPPPDVADGLRAAYRSNAARQILFRHQLRDALAALNEAGVEPAPVKGALYLLEDTFGDIGERVMVDLDLVVTPSELADAVAALEHIGYRRRDRPDFTHPHELPMTAENKLGAVELHTRLGVPAVTAVLPTSEFLECAAPVTHDGLRYRRPQSDHLLIHHVLHGQIQDRNHAVFGLPLRQLHTFTVAARAWSGDVDWRRVAARFETHGLAPVLSSYVDLAHRLFGLDGADIATATGHRSLRLAARRTTCLASATLGWPSHVARNLSNAFAADYLRDRYDEHTPLTILRGRHAVRLWRDRGGATLGEAVRPWM